MDKYVVYKISGGLCHMLYTINYLIQFSMIYNRTIVIDCGGGCFNNDFDKYFSIPSLKLNRDYYTKFNYDRLPEKRELCRKSGRYIWDNFRMTWDEISNSKDNVIICTFLTGQALDKILPNWHIFVKPEILKLIGPKINSQYIGLHYRNTDIKNDLGELVKGIDKYNINKIYLATDDYNGRDKLDGLRKGKFEILQFTKPDRDYPNGIHYMSKDKDKVIISSLIDLYHLINSTHFIPSLNGVYNGKLHKSGFSRFVIKNRNEKIDFFNK